MKIEKNSLKKDISNEKISNKINNTYKIKELIHNKTIIASLFIIIISIIASIPMFNPNFNIQFDDGVQHICRLIGTEQSLKEGELIPAIMSNFCNGFGYSWNLFYSPLTSYMPLIFRIFTSSYEMCLKLFMMAVSIATGFSMYFFIKKFLKGKRNCNNAKENETKDKIINDLDDNKIEMISILASILYILLPYRLNDMYLRIAVAELTSFIFLPIVFNGLYSIVNLKEKSYLLIVGGVGMLLTHSLLTIYLIIFCFIYILINLKEINKKTICTLIFDTIIILLITAFYWVPLLQSKISADYEVFNQSHMIRLDAMIALKPKLYEIAFLVPGRMFYGIGILTIIGTALSFTILKKKDTNRKNYIFFLICGLVSIIMSLDIFPFEKLPSLFTMMQFSFRMIEFEGFFLVIVASIAIGLSIDKFNLHTVLGFTCISILLLLPNLKELQHGRYYTEDELINGIRVTSETGRVHAGCASFEYLPTEAFENRKYIENREDVPIILNINDYLYSQEGKNNSESIKVPKIYNYNKNGTFCNFNIGFNYESVENTTQKEEEADKNKEDEERFHNDEIVVELPYIYYIGYNVRYIDSEGNSYKVETYESENGFLCVNLPNEEIEVIIEYTGTIIMKISYLISIITVIGIILIRIKRAVRK